MSAVMEALVRLEKAVAAVEQGMGRVEDSTRGYQRDMFGGPSVPLEDSANNVKAAVAQKLDQTIAKVESLLEDA